MIERRDRAVLGREREQQPLGLLVVAQGLPYREEAHRRIAGRNAVTEGRLMLAGRLGVAGEVGGGRARDAQDPQCPAVERPAAFMPPINDGYE